MEFGTYEVGALGAGDFDELTAKQADAVAERAIAEMPAALARAVDDLGEPDPARADAQLFAAGEWFLDRLPAAYGAARRGSWWSRAMRRSSPTDLAVPAVPEVGGPWHPAWADTDRASVPYWCWFRSGSGLFGPLGPAVVAQIDALTAYVATMILRAHDDALIRRSSGSASAVDYRQPVVKVGDGREFALPSRFDVLAVRALDPEHPHHAGARDLAAFVRRHAIWMRSLPVSVGEPEARAFTLVPGPSAGEFLVAFDDEIAHDRSSSIDRLVERLDAAATIDRVIRADREIVLISASDASVGDLEGLLDRIWNSELA